MTRTPAMKGDDMTILDDSILNFGPYILCKKSSQNTINFQAVVLKHQNRTALSIFMDDKIGAHPSLSHCG
jgi:hypothetical protein